MIRRRALLNCTAWAGTKAPCRMDSPFTRISASVAPGDEPLELADLTLKHRTGIT